ncbi:MAG: hypothetical protein ACM3PT_00480 [Deltaproteobacteria bacterium]
MNINKKILIISMILFWRFTSDSQINCVSHDKLLISFMIDSSKTIEFEENKIGNYFPSPFYSQDVMWTERYEWNIRSTKFTKLSELYGEALKNKDIHKNMVWKDRFTDDVYIGIFDKLLRFNKNKLNYDTLNIKHLTSFLDLNNYILFGTFNGLYLMYRNTNKIIYEDKLPQNIIINSIENYNEDTVIINSIFLYDTKNLTVQKKTTIPDSKVFDRSKEYSFQVRKNLPMGENFAICKSSECTWFYRENDLFYTKDNKLFYKFVNFPQGYIRQFEQDSLNLYILFNKKLIIISKNFIFKNSILYDYEEYNRLVENYFKESEIIYGSIRNTEKFINSVKLLYKNKEYNKYTDINNLIKSMPSHLENAIGNDNILNIINLLDKGSIDGKFRYYVLKGLNKYYLTKADVRNSIIFFKKMKQEFPEINEECVIKSYDSALKFSYSLDSLEALNLTPDSLIFNQAVLRMKLIESSCWFGDSYYILDIVKEKYEELLQKYPQSKLADNAELWLIENQFSGDEGGLPTSSIIYFQDFKKKYPDSDVLFDVAMNISHAYMNCESENPDTIVNCYENGIMELQSVLNQLKNDSSKYNVILSSIKQLNYEKIYRIFKIELSTEKVKFLKGEDITITVKIINLTSKKQKIKLYNSSSKLTFGVSSENVKNCFIPSTKIDTKMIEQTLLREEPIIQKVILNKDARDWSKGRNGKFVLIKPGIYYISAMDSNLHLNSNQIKIIVD